MLNRFFCLVIIVLVGCNVPTDDQKQKNKSEQTTKKDSVLVEVVKQDTLFKIQKINLNTLPKCSIPLKSLDFSFYFKDRFKRKSDTSGLKVSLSKHADSLNQGILLNQLPKLVVGIKCDSAHKAISSYFLKIGGYKSDSLYDYGFNHYAHHPIRVLETFEVYKLGPKKLFVVHEADAIEYKEYLFSTWTIVNDSIYLNKVLKEFPSVGLYGEFKLEFENYTNDSVFYVNTAAILGEVDEEDTTDPHVYEKYQLIWPDSLVRE